MKVNLKHIALFVLGVIAAVLLFRVFACNKGKDNPQRPAIELRDTLIHEHTRALARDSIELRRRQDSIDARERARAQKEKERERNQVKQQTLKRKSEAIKNHIDSDGFTADSLRRAFTEFD